MPRAVTRSLAAIIAGDIPGLGPTSPAAKWLSFKSAANALYEATSDEEDLEEYYRAESELVAALADGGLWAEGIEVGREPPEYFRIPEAWWAGALVDHDAPTKRAPIGRTIVHVHSSVVRRRTGQDTSVEYRSVRIPTEQFENRYPPRDIDELIRRWYPDLAGAADKPEAFRTGFAGRPSGRPLIVAEMKRRAKSGELKSSLRQEAKALADWYALAHPAAPSMKASAIKFSLGSLYRELVSAGGQKLS